MKQEDFLNIARAATQEFAAAALAEVGAIARQAVPDPTEASRQLEADALKAAVFAYRVWARLRIGRGALELELGKVPS